MKEISLKISDIDCAACVERLNRALGAVNGVRDGGGELRIRPRAHKL